MKYFRTFLLPLSPFSCLGLVVGFGASLVRDSASVMIGHYFKRRRQFVEMIVMAGEGVGIALFSVIIKEGIGLVFLVYSIFHPQIQFSVPFIFIQFFITSVQPYNDAQQENWMASRITICYSANVDKFLHGSAIPSSFSLSSTT